ncbi:SWIM zinc finger family protein [Paenibacillus sp. HWE-109]|uniref:SWIM zinc finger family protein n=1 Tax=Paenibacillus sp. HWE-109 TaxID=1306526 RepID=UPI001EDDC231|nr:SWIM zinc finger family protein [Paenibacillus sp. HWE-109]UKS24447.1 SWIM zinc finger family protein [Paenibacillus sp. HWE-109]
MDHLTESYVDSLALNSSAIKNGKDLVKKNSFPLLCQSEDKSLIFGACKGSGKEPYQCSVDISKEANPVFRCTCPSRQFPCKHNLGLMYAFTSGKTFVTAPVPQDIVDKREKAEKREEKKKESPDPAAPAVKRKTNKSALLKKITAQLEGISIAEKLILQMVQSGIGSLDNKALQTAQEQAKQLGNYYIPGIQTAIRLLLLQFREEEDREAMYGKVIEQLTTLQALLKKSNEYLTSRLDNPDQPMDTNSTLEEWIGHAWQIAELREYGRVRSEAELLQLSFRSYTDKARGEFVDEGYWADLGNGKLHLTRNYRPFRAAKYIREDDSVFRIVQAGELAEYPGELNTRVRWEESAFREVTSSDLQRIREAAQSSFPEVIKQVKNQIKNPLSDKHPVVLLPFTGIQRTDTSYVLVDAQGKQLPLADIPYLSEPTTHLLSLLNKTFLNNQVMLVMFEQDWQQNKLVAQPLSVITADEIIRLLY